MKIRFLFLIFLICINTAWADFSNTKVWHHPRYIHDNEPFLLELRGEWPDDCHPGEQKPVITEYTGDSVLIEFETIVEHVTCNDVVTPYRVLVDMSDVIDSVEGEFRILDVTVRFAGAELKNQLEKLCDFCDPPPPPEDIKPEAGLYYSEGLEQQGLLLARQNQRMGVFPLIYDESGSSEWLFGGGGIVEDVFFVELFEATGGQCLGCLPPAEAPILNPVGKFSMLMDNEGIIQVKINDGLFQEYRPQEFGYGFFKITADEGETSVRIPDLSGRWAFSEIKSDVAYSPPTAVLPWVFDITLRENADPPLPTIGIYPPLPDSFLPADVWYAILDMDGVLIAEMACEYRHEMVCDLKSPMISEFDAWFEVKFSSLERIKMTNMDPQPVSGLRNGAGTAVRID